MKINAFVTIHLRKNGPTILFEGALQCGSVVTSILFSVVVGGLNRTKLQFLFPYSFTRTWIGNGFDYVNK